MSSEDLPGRWSFTLAYDFGSSFASSAIQHRLYPLPDAVWQRVSFAGMPLVDVLESPTRKYKAFYVTPCPNRIKRLRTVPGVGPITALTWALEIGDVSRFRSIKQAISYCGLCGDERSSADKAMCMQLSKQRNKHIQRALVEAAKLAPRQNHEIAVIYDQERQKGNSNRATLAVARKMVAYLLVVDRQQRDFVPAEERRTTAA